ncbi:MAG: hypothetical protein IPK79_10295 [Vampirovibrionales bacterium]|nr:hypothetical protein [Vampirovibrionales bacterium]
MASIDKIYGNNPFASSMVAMPGVASPGRVSQPQQTPRFQGADGGLNDKSFENAVAGNCYTLGAQKLQPANYSAPVFGGYGQARDIAFA